MTANFIGAGLSTAVIGDLPLRKAPRERPAKGDLILHVGSTKTGTSAIQSGLALNFERLQAAGILYPKSHVHEAAAAGHVTAGNGKIFRQFRVRNEVNALVARSRLEAELERIAHDARGRTVLFSSEALGGIKLTHLDELGIFFSKYFGSITVIYYVRHLTDHAASTYAEYVKRRGMTASFTTFANELYRAPFQRTIETYEAVFSAQNVRCILYDETRGDAYGSFLQDLGISASDHLKPGVVNRSISNEELIVFRTLNGYQLRTALIAKIVEDYTFRNGPPEKSVTPISRSALDGISQNNRDIIEFVNSRVQGGPVRVASEKALSRVIEMEPDTSELHPVIVANLLMSGVHVLKRRESDADISKKQSHQLDDERLRNIRKHAIERLSEIADEAAKQVSQGSERIADFLEQGALAIREYESGIPPKNTW